MGQPAARLTDMHTCPMVTGIVPHVGGPIIAPGCPTVLIGALPAARVTDECVCVGPTDVIVVGAFTTLIGGLPAARLGDATAHGGVIVVGDPTVLIGDGAGNDDDDDSDPDGDEADADADDGDEASEDALPDQSEDQPPTDTPATQAPDSAQPVEELHAQAELGDWNNPDYMASAPNVDAPAGADMGAASGLGDQTGLSAGEMGALPTNETAPDGAFQLGATQNEDISSGPMDGSVAGGGQWSSSDVSGQVVGGGGADGGGLSTGEQAPASAFQLNATQNTYNPSAGQSGSAPPPPGGPGPGVPSTGAPASPRSFQLNASQNAYNPGSTGSPAPPKPFKLGATQNVTVPPPRPPPLPAPSPPKTFKLGASQNVAVPPAKPPPPAPPPARPGGFVPGRLSAHYESNGDPGRISPGKGDLGSTSYGAYQIIKGNVSSFVAHEGARWPELKGKAPGGAAFNAAWTGVAAKDRANFLAAQHAYISRTHYEPQTALLRGAANVDVGAHSNALQDVVWSTSVQHGPGTTIVSDAMRNVMARGIKPDDPRFDRAVINAVYDERGRMRADGNLAHFYDNDAKTQHGVAQRFPKERADALKELALEHAAQNR